MAAKLDGTELGDRCLEVRFSNSVDRFDIGFRGRVDMNEIEQLTGRTLLIKSDEMTCDLEKISKDFEGIHKLFELERDLGAGLPALTARFFLVEFTSLEKAQSAIKKNDLFGYTVAEAKNHMQAYTVGTGGVVYSSSTSNSTAAATIHSTEEVLIYGVPASKLLEPTISRSYPASTSLENQMPQYRERRGDRDHGRHHRDYERGDRHNRSGRRSRSRSRSGDRHRPRRP